ncbi:MAG: FAD-dependent oxidoreductase [Candidatus Thermoplasmatota archaeon]|nr:FAD-dependent oxidoreductase [Candidatus Thermoplasmatota archaeon]
MIGCGAGGGTAAQFARKTDRKADVVVFEKGKYPQYSKCGLPYAISGKIPSFSSLVEFSEEWFEKAKIDLFLETTVERIDVGKKIVLAKKGNETIEKSYGKLVIATGAVPFIPPIDGIKENGRLLKGIFCVRTIDDAKMILSAVKKGGNVSIIGAGLIGLEMADNLNEMGMNVTVVEALDQILPNALDADMAKIVQEEMPSHIKIFTSHLATKTEGDGGSISKILIKNNETGETQEIETNLLILSAGCNAETTLAKDAGCKLNEKGYIVVNEKSETSVRDIYAVGDCTEFIDFVTKKPMPIGLGSIGVRQAIAAGINAAGGEHLLPFGVLKTCTSHLFGLEVASVGSTISSYECEIVSGKFNGSSLPEYFPGGKPITIKVFAEESGKILGAQAVGDNAAQRINTFACAILAGMDVDTLRKLETAYAPPVAPTLDPVTLACDVVFMKLDRRRR